VNRGRLEAFSDGVFAVAITLLVLDLAVAGPGPGHGSLAHQLAHRWPGFAAYVISFLTIGIIWVNHHALVSNLKVVTRPLMFLNLLLLMFVVLVPSRRRRLRRAGRGRGLRRRDAGDVGQLCRHVRMVARRGARLRVRAPG
jgi:hypothetical protein